MKPLSVTIQMKATEQYFPVVMFIIIIIIIIIMMFFFCRTRWF